MIYYMIGPRRVIIAVIADEKAFLKKNRKNLFIRGIYGIINEALKNI